MSHDLMNLCLVLEKTRLNYPDRPIEQDIPNISTKYNPSGELVIIINEYTLVIRFSLEMFSQVLYQHITQRTLHNIQLEA